MEEDHKIVCWCTHCRAMAYWHIRVPRNGNSNKNAVGPEWGLNFLTGTTGPQKKQTLGPTDHPVCVGDCPPLKTITRPGADSELCSRDHRSLEKNTLDTGGPPAFRRDCPPSKKNPSARPGPWIFLFHGPPVPRKKTRTQVVLQFFKGLRVT